MNPIDFYSKTLMRRNALKRLKTPIVIFEHIPKTGGSSFWRSLVWADPSPTQTLRIVDLFARAAESTSTLVITKPDEALLMDPTSERASEVQCLFMDAIDEYSNQVSTLRKDSDSKPRLLIHHHDPIKLRTGGKWDQLTSRLFLVRDPVVRLLSHYRHEIIHSVIPDCESLAEYVHRRPWQIDLQSRWIRRALTDSSERPVGQSISLTPGWIVQMSDYVHLGPETESVVQALGLKYVRPIHFDATQTDRRTWRISEQDLDFLGSSEFLDAAQAERNLIDVFRERVNGRPVRQFDPGLGFEIGRAS